MVHHKDAGFVLQQSIWPGADTGLSDTLFLRSDAPVLAEADGLTLAQGQSVSTDTFVNVFNLAKWKKHCALGTLNLSARLSGPATLRVFATDAQATRHMVCEVSVDDDAAAPLLIPIDQSTLPLETETLITEVTAHEPVRLQALDWWQPEAPLRSPRILAVITAFRHPEMVVEAAEAFSAFRDAAGLAGKVDLAIVDNSRSLDPARAPDGVQIIPNDNTGGSGGFSRGLLAAKAEGYSHAIFMDDDVGVDPQFFYRTWAFLAASTSPRVAIPGGLMNARSPDRLWEFGAVFDRHSTPLFRDLDLTDFDNVTTLERAAVTATTPGYYGGWWYFAFPIEGLKHFPFPFFVRGDDISFSLENDFEFVPISGLACRQDIDFLEKISPATNYLDLRMHLVLRLLSTDPPCTGRDLYDMANFFYKNALVNFSYASIAAMALALRDVTSGPDHFARADGVLGRMGEIGRANTSEVWEKGRAVPKHSQPTGRVRKAFVLTFNGHYLPFAGLLSRYEPVLHPGQRNADLIFGARRIYLIKEQDGEVMTLRRNRLRAAVASVRFWLALAKLLRRRKAVVADWTKGYGRLASPEYWSQTLLGETPARR